MRLAVTAGSLYESDDERCYAHFVEHMAFNGTTHFPASELVKFLQREGAQFGPHINATTSPSRTARTSVTTLHTGVNIFRNFASLTSTNSRTSTSELIECSATSSIPRRGCRKEVIAWCSAAGAVGRLWQLKFLFDKPRPEPSFHVMASSEKKPFSFLVLFLDLVFTAIAFCIFYWLVNNHVPSNDPKMIMLWGGLASACMTGVFWLALQMIKTVYVFQRDTRK